MKWFVYGVVTLCITFAAILSIPLSLVLGISETSALILIALVLLLLVVAEVIYYLEDEEIK